MLPRVGDTSILRNGGVYKYIYQNNSVPSKMVAFSTHRNEETKFQTFDSLCQRFLLIDRIAKGVIKMLHTKFQKISLELC